jgi:hypothetical protein
MARTSEKFKYNNPGICLRCHGFAQFERGFSLYNLALALHHRQFTDVLNRVRRYLLLCGSRTIGPLP